jgi:hypothetical protein
MSLPNAHVDRAGQKLNPQAETVDPGSASNALLGGFEMNLLPMGMSLTPPTQSWGINFGGGLNSTAVIVECRNRGLRPDWILFADTGSEMPGTLEHVERMRIWCDGWQEVTTVRWIRKEGHHEPLHDNCLRTGHLPSKAYGLAGCTDKWKIQPMDRWRKAHGFQQGSFAVGYDAGEAKRISSACKRGDMPGFTAWYPLVAWGIDRAGCDEICKKENITVGKSSCFMCPNMRRNEWLDLRKEHPDLFELAMQIEDQAAANGNKGRGGGGLYKGTLRGLEQAEDTQTTIADILEDRCHHGGCFT